MSQDKPAITNLLEIYAALTGKTVTEIEEMYRGKGYGDFKRDRGGPRGGLSPSPRTGARTARRPRELDGILEAGAERRARWPSPPCTMPRPGWAWISAETRGKILEVLRAIPQGVLYSTTDWHRILGDDKRRIQRLDELEAEGHRGKERRRSDSTLQAQGGELMGACYIVGQDDGLYAR